MTLRNHALNWLFRQWPYATIFTVPFLLLLTPFWWSAFGLPLTLIYLQLPIYMLHQFEEHDQDRFRLFLNALLGGGRELLTPEAIFWINSLLVWAVDLLALFLAYYVDLSWGLIAFYLPLINGITHVAMFLRLGRYNPGLISGLLLFLPFSIWGIVVVSHASGAGLMAQLIALGGALAIHAVIMVHVLRRKMALTESQR